jgi:hypothetical protein
MPSLTDSIVSRRRARARRRCFFLLAVVLLPACAEVAPWERETMASARMRLDPDANEQAMVASRHRTREESTITAGTAGTSSASGGGCGCN